jgi:hypothetical protein
VYEVGEERDAQRPRLDERLRQGRQGQDDEAPRHSADAQPRADD